MFENKRIGFIGAGNMATALIKGILKANLVPSDFVSASDVDIEKLDSLKSEYGINVVFKDNEKLVTESDIIVLAIKPQIFEKILKEIAPKLDKSKLIISIAAGISTEYIENIVEKDLKIVRAMPNTPALILEGATAIAPGAHVAEDDLRIAYKIFDAVGKVAVVDESQMDAVTGLSGSGPAYIFMIIEALSDAGVKMGLSRSVAMKLAAQTVMGAAKLQIETDMHPGRLKDMVTSPGGTAIAGIHTLEQGGLRTTLINAVESATMRSIELGRKNGK
ncbi:pyrroline-5-carboxylate reductase [Deferribacteraceae bacterium V6Fe1]|uniref:pyrroline-5-carboxylate reductase n=1 Tax=Deferrivibrio essentukiensis TaxID=2880922 RepID=UPI001F613E0D|nr:pyrroline-5-carboxylate reductase [Deferrivibrio essentukiensis]MCB4204999.1 pyrroline-5-carboxylate reductase [Deferrivibrio essentukiensis]UOD34686.1 pyrroline-5-carboxylate reductase [Deferribacteraceae bacterium V6Fe1]